MSQSLEPARSAFGPVAGSDRLLNLDFVRGMALLGILFVNIGVMFGPVAAISNPNYSLSETGLDRAASLFVQVFCQGKFVTIFSTLFAYGLFGQLERAEAAGRSAVGFALRRLVPLLCFGALHAVFVWYGDILFIYATMGAWLLVFRYLRTRTLVTLGVGLVGMGVLLSIGLGMVGLALLPEANPGAEPSEQSVLGLLMRQKGPDHPVWIATEIAAYRDGPWWRAQEFRLWSWGFNLIATVLMLGWLILGMFCVGSVLWRVRFFSQEQASLRRRVVGICLPIGVVIEMGVVALLVWGAGNRRWEMVATAIRELGLFVLPMAYLSGFALLADRFPGLLVRMVGSAGKMSLTVYLMESVLATGLAYHWGLGLFGRVGPAGQLGIAVGIWASLVVCSHLWLRCFRRGPMEWLWRWLEYGRMDEAAGRPGVRSEAVVS